MSAVRTPASTRLVSIQILRGLPRLTLSELEIILGLMSDKLISSFESLNLLLFLVVSNEYSTGFCVLQASSVEFLSKKV